MRSRQAISWRRGGFGGRGGVRDRATGGPWRITGSDLDFSLRSVLLVVEPGGDKLEERGVRGERRGTGSGRDSFQNGPKKCQGGFLNS